MQFSELSFDERHPIILPKSRLALLIIRYHHDLMKHAGVPAVLASLRNQYWIIVARRIAKHSLPNLDAQACNQPMAPLPGLHIKQAPQFSVIGIDHTGALYCCDAPGKKFYILLFTCAVVRAVQLELVNSLSTSDTVLAIRRFTARCGLPTVIYSDNAKAFVAAPTALGKEFGYLAYE